VLLNNLALFFEPIVEMTRPYFVEVLKLKLLQLPMLDTKHQFALMSLIYTVVNMAELSVNGVEAFLLLHLRFFLVHPYLEELLVLLLLPRLLNCVLLLLDFLLRGFDLLLFKQELLPLPLVLLFETLLQLIQVWHLLEIVPDPLALSLLMMHEVIVAPLHPVL